MKGQIQLEIKRRLGAAGPAATKVFEKTTDLPLKIMR
jgi:hypothetical protein